MKPVKRKYKETQKSEKPVWYLSVLAALSLVMFVVTSLQPNVITPPRNKLIEVNLSSIPIARVQENPIISAQTAIVYDPVSAVVLYEKNADTKVSPVSTTKMISGIIALNGMEKSAIIEVPKIEVEPQIMKLAPGEQITVQDLLYGILVWSANDAAELVARAYPGGRDKFITDMNEISRQYGMYNTSFLNPSGLPEPNHYSTARDLARFAAIAMKNPEFANIVQTKEITVTSVDGKITHKLVNLNELLTSVPGVLGIKTGWSEESGGALVTYISRDNKPIIIVVLGSTDRFVDSKILIEWVYANHEWFATSRNNRL